MLSLTLIWVIHEFKFKTYGFEKIVSDLFLISFHHGQMSVLCMGWERLCDLLHVRRLQNSTCALKGIFSNSWIEESVTVH